MPSPSTLSTAYFMWALSHSYFESLCIVAAQRVASWFLSRRPIWAGREMIKIGIAAPCKDLLIAFPFGALRLCQGQRRSNNHVHSCGPRGNYEWIGSNWFAYHNFVVLICPVWGCGLNAKQSRCFLICLWNLTWNSCRFVPHGSYISWTNGDVFCFFPSA